MVDPDKVRGDIGRSFSPEPEREQQVDPNKFKRVMKVEETDESQKRQKRRLKKEEEEGDDDDVEEKVAPPPSSSFAEFMEDKDELDNLFDAESAGVRKRAAPQASKQAPAPGTISTEGVEEEEAAPQTQAQEPEPPSYQPQASTQEAQLSTNSEQESFYGRQQQEAQQTPQEEGMPSYPGAFPEPPTFEQAQKTPEEETTTPLETAQTPEEQKQEAQEKKTEEDASLLATQPELGALKSKKKPPPKPAAPIEAMPGHKEEKGAIPTEAKTEEMTPKKQLTASPKKEMTPSVKADEKSVVPTAAEKGEKAAEKPLEAPFALEERFPSERKDAHIEKAGIEELEKKELQKGKATPSLTGLPTEGAPLARPIAGATLDRFTPEQVREKKMGKLTGAAAEEGLTAPGLPEPEMGMLGEGKKEKKDDFPFINAVALTAVLPSIEQPFSAAAPQADAPAYTKLTPEVFELFEKTIGSITVQDHSGITSTTVTVNMPGSVFDGAQIILDQYSTAPNSYNLQLIGTPQAVSAFTANMEDLVAAFKQSEHSFEVNMLKPALATKKPLIRRKGAAGGKKEKK